MADGSPQLAAARLRREWLRAISAGLLAAIAVGFVIHALWKTKPGRATVQAILEFEPGDGKESLDLERVRGELLSPDALHAAVESSGQASDGLSVEAWQRAMSVHRAAPSPAIALERIALEVPTHDDASAVAVLQHLTQNFLRTRHRDGSLAVHASTELANARSEVSSALTREDAARRTLDALVREQLDRLRRVSQSSKEPPSEPGEAPAAKRERKVNPAWQRASDDLEALEAKREKMLLSLTTEHPMVKDVEGELEELQSRHAGLPRYLETPDDEPQPRLAPRPALSNEHLLAAATAMAGDQAKVRDALATYEAARAKRMEAQGAVEVLERTTADAPGKAPRYSLVQSAQVVRQEPGTASLARLLAIAVSALLAFFVIAVSCRPRRRCDRLTTIDDISQLLNVPVIAHLRLNEANAV